MREYLCTFMIISGWIIRVMRNVTDKSLKNIWVYFRKSVYMIHVSFKYSMSKDIMREYLCTFMIISGWIIRAMRNVTDKSLRNIWVYFRKSVYMIHVSFKYSMSKDIMREYLCTFMIISGWIIRAMRNVTGKSCKKITTHFMFLTLSRKSCPSWDSVEKYGSARQATYASIIRRMCFA